MKIPYFSKWSERLHSTLRHIMTAICNVNDEVQNLKNDDQKEINLIVLATLQRLLLDHGVNAESGKYDGDVELAQAITEKIVELEK